MDWLSEVAGIVLGWLLGAGGAVLDWIFAVASAILGWVLAVAGAILGWIFAVVGTLLDWFLKQGLVGWGAALTGCSAFLAYRRYRSEKHDLIKREWEILGLVQEKWSHFNGEVIIEEIQVALQLQSARVEYAGRDFEAIHATGVVGAGGPQSFPGTLHLPMTYRRYCLSLEKRGYLASIGPSTDEHERYELTVEGERFIKKNRLRLLLNNPHGRLSRYRRRVLGIPSFLWSHLRSSYGGLSLAWYRRRYRFSRPPKRDKAD